MKDPTELLFVAKTIEKGEENDENLMDKIKRIEKNIEINQRQNTEAIQGIAELIMSIKASTGLGDESNENGWKENKKFKDKKNKESFNFLGFFRR